MFTFDVLVEMVEFRGRERALLTGEHALGDDFVALRNGAVRRRNIRHVRMLERRRDMCVSQATSIDEVRNSRSYARLGNVVASLPVSKCPSRRVDYHGQSGEYSTCGSMLGAV